jgi:two-component system, chemotaxis family, protein-glutamate methylesterase/glutaminase
VIRVLVADDSLTVRRHLIEVLANAPGFTVVGEAANGKEAIALCQLHRPDVVTLDMAMPVMSGLAATEYIMAHCPTPILIVSSSVNRGELFKTYEALAAGAVDVLEKPRGDEGEGVWEQGFLATVRLVSRIRVITHLRRRLDVTPQPVEVPTVAPAGGPITVIAIGASTGGPAALVEVLRAFPAQMQVTILVVLHIGAPFATGFAEWLDGQIRRPVRCAVNGERLVDLRGAVIMAVPERHLVIQGGRLRLSDDPPRHSCRPSIDVLFDSVAREIGPGAAACLLTGMGRDGADGLLKIRRAGGHTLAQDEATSVVYGMPREAALIGAAERVLGLSLLGPAMVQLVEARK